MHVSNTRQNIAVGTVFLLQLLDAFIDILQVSNLTLLQVKEACHLLLIQHGVALNLSFLVNGVFHHMIDYLYALRNQLEFRAQVIEPAHVINSTQIFAQASFSKLHARLGFQSSSNLCLRHSLITGNNLLGNGFSQIGSQACFLLAFRCSLRYRGISTCSRCLDFFGVNRSSQQHCCQTYCQRPP